MENGELIEQLGKIWRVRILNVITEIENTTIVSEDKSERLVLSPSVLSQALSDIHRICKSQMDDYRDGMKTPRKHRLEKEFPVSVVLKKLQEQGEWKPPLAPLSNALREVLSERGHPLID